MQVPYFGKPSGTTDPKAADHGSQTEVSAPSPHAPRATANKARPPSGRCTVHAQGLKSWGGGFIGMGFCRAAELRIADHAAGPTPRGTMSEGIDAFRYCLGVRWLVTGRNRLCL